MEPPRLKIAGPARASADAGRNSRLPAAGGIAAPCMRALCACGAHMPHMRSRPSLPSGRVT